MSIAPVTGIKVPVSFMGKAETTEGKKPKIDPSEEVDKFNKEANELGDALNDTGAAVTKVTGAAASVAAPIVAIKATAGKFLGNLFKTAVKDADGNPVVDLVRTPKELLNEAGDALSDKLDADQMKQVVYKMKNSKVKIGLAIAAAVVAAGVFIKNSMDKKKAEAAEAEAEAAAAAAPEAPEAETTPEVEETPEEE